MRWQRSRRWGKVTVGRTALGSLTANVQGFQRVELSRVGDAYTHAELLLYVRIRRGGCHAPQIHWQPLVILQVWIDSIGGNRFCRKLDGFTSSNIAASEFYRCASFRH